jgi:ABC-2 type transport system permease protein
MTRVPPGGGVVRGRAAGFWHDLATVATRALRQLRREPASLLPAVFVPAFFYVVNLGALGHVAEAGGLDYKAFLLPMAIAFAVTGVSRAPTLVTDIRSGYFDRLCLTPVRRSALLLGLMAADVVVIIALTIPVLVLGFALGVRFSTGVEGVTVFVGLAALWGLVFTGFPYAVALKTGSPAAVNATFVVFFPFAFLTDAVIPQGRPHHLVCLCSYLQPGHLLTGCSTFGHRRRLAGPSPSGGAGRLGRVGASSV